MDTRSNPSRDIFLGVALGAAITLVAWLVFNHASQLRLTAFGGDDTELTPMPDNYMESMYPSHFSEKIYGNGVKSSCAEAKQQAVASGQQRLQQLLTQCEAVGGTPSHAPISLAETTFNPWCGNGSTRDEECCYNAEYGFYTTEHHWSFYCLEETVEPESGDSSSDAATPEPWESEGDDLI